MRLAFDDILQIIKIIKECQDSELYLEVDDVKLSVSRGDVGTEKRNMPSLFNTSNNCQAKPQSKPEQRFVQATQNQTMAQQATVPQAVSTIKDDVPLEGLVAIRATVTSVFFRRPSQAEPPFVEIGSEVQEDTTVCLLEVMKCFRSVVAGVRGRIEKICVEDEQTVEGEQVLFWVRQV